MGGRWVVGGLRPLGLGLAGREGEIESGTCTRYRGRVAAEYRVTD